MSTTVTPERGTAWNRGMDWLFSQGVSTVLLGALAFGLWYGIPWARACMKEDLTQILQSTERNIDKTVEAFKEDQTRDQDLIDHLLERKRVGLNP